MFFTIIIFFLVLSILVLIHEAGHFFVAKLSGMIVEEFGLGLPPRAFGIKFRGTIYSLNWLPFGGFVKIFGENPEDTEKVSPEKAKKAFNNRPWYLRALVLMAGPFMNFVLAVAIISFMFTKGVYVPAGQVKVVAVEKGSPAFKAGVRNEDAILAIGKNKTKSVEDIVRFSKQFAGRNVGITVLRQKETLKFKLVPRVNPPAGRGALGVTITDLGIKKYSLLEAPIEGLKQSLAISKRFYIELGKTLFKVITLQKPTLEITGPVGIAKLTGEAVKEGFDTVLQLMGLLSLNLALINIFPFPALDGGQLAFVVIEAVTRRKIAEKVKAAVNGAGFALLLFLIFLISLNDIRKLLVR